MAIIAMDMKSMGRLRKDTMVATVMSNIGLGIMAAENEIHLVKTKVGDRYVLEEMLRGGFLIGGEQSGHIILLEESTTGDGLLSALRLLRALKYRGERLSEARRIMTVLPQVLKNARVPNGVKKRVMTDPDILDVIQRLEEQLADRGRVLVRASGTEPVIRVMVEGENIDLINQMADQLTELIVSRYGI
jgi:phosphoglucosamine mutase